MLFRMLFGLIRLACATSWWLRIIFSFIRWKYEV